MLFNLPNGKVIQITFEQFLDMTDEDIQYFMSLNFGDYVTSPWHESSFSKKKRKSQTSEPEDIDTSVDFTPEDEDKSHGDNQGIEEIPLDECPDVLDIPDGMIE